MKSAVSSWKNIAANEQSLDAYLAEHFGDKSKFRISKRIYRAGDRNTGGMVSAICFVLHGSCRYTFGDTQLDLTEGDRCELPEGRCSFEVLGDGGCTTISVLRIPSA